MAQLDIGTIIFATAGLGLAVSFAVVAGVVSARVFFHATSAPGTPGAQDDNRP